jgi:hypothetical protein
VTGCRREPPPPVDVNLATVAVDSSTIAISVRDFAVRSESGQLLWSFVVVCEQPGGCSGLLDLEVVYRSRAGERRLTMMREVDLPHGGTVKLGRTGSLDTVERVDRVRVAVRREGAGAVSSPAVGARVTPLRPTPIS